MPRTAKKRPAFKLPEISPGNWRGEISGSCTVNFGQVVQPSLSLSLEVTRGQFSDMLRMLEAKRLKEFHFTVEERAGGSWPLHSWGMGTTLG